MSKAIFLGTFNPPHQGHRDAVTSVWSWNKKNNLIDLESIYIIPCWQNPNKSYVTSFSNRYRMCINEFSELSDYCCIDDIENIIRPKYTYELLDRFHNNIDEYIKDDFYWIITEETFNELQRGEWKESERLLKENKFILLYDVANGKPNINENVYLVPLISTCNIHSTELRNSFWINAKYDKYITKETRNYIIEHNLYK